MLFLAEGYSEGLRRFEDKWHGKTYAGGRAKLRVREVKLYTCSVNEVGKDECLRDFAHICNNLKREVKDGQFFRWARLGSWVRRVGKLFGLKYNNERVEPLYKVNPYVAGDSVPAHFVFLGEIKDPRVLREGDFGFLNEEIV